MHIDHPSVQLPAAAVAVASTTTEFWYSPYWNPIYQFLPWAELAQVSAVIIITSGLIQWAAKKYFK